MDAVGDALNRINNSPAVRAVKEGATQGIKVAAAKVTSTAGSTAADALGSGVSAALTAYAMYRVNPKAGVPDYREAFKAGVKTSVVNSAKKFNFENIPVEQSKVFNKPSPEKKQEASENGSNKAASNNADKAEAAAKRAASEKAWNNRFESGKAEVDDAIRRVTDSSAKGTKEKR
jgi:hypothetical protein